MKFDPKNQTFKVDVETIWDERSGIIRSRVGEFHDVVLRTQERQVREALIALGWTPPPEKTEP